MAMDKERIKRRLLDIERYSERLKTIVPGSMAEYRKSDVTIKSAMERNLQLISDMELEVLVLLYKTLELSLASDDDSLMDRFSGKMNGKVLSAIKERRVLRNLLIHAYSDKSYDEKAYAQASDLTDVKAFMKEAEKLIDK